MAMLDEILDVVAQKTGLDRSRLVPEARLSDLAISSLDMVEVIFVLEDKLGIELTFNANTAGRDFRTLGDVIKAVEAQLPHA